MKGDNSPSLAKVIRKTVEHEHEISKTKEKLERLQKQKKISEREAEEADEEIG